MAEHLLGMAHLQYLEGGRFNTALERVSRSNLGNWPCSPGFAGIPKRLARRAIVFSPAHTPLPRRDVVAMIPVSSAPRAEARIANVEHRVPLRLVIAYAEMQHRLGELLSAAPPSYASHRLQLPGAISQAWRQTSFRGPTLATNHRRALALRWRGKATLPWNERTSIQVYRAKPAKPWLERRGFEGLRDGSVRVSSRPWPRSAAKEITLQSGLPTLGAVREMTETLGRPHPR